MIIPPHRPEPAIRNRQRAHTLTDRLRRPAVIAGAGLVLAVLATTAGAAPELEKVTHGVLKWTDASGRIHYGDRPPLRQARVTMLPGVAATASRDAAAAAGTGASIPRSLRTIAARQPVTLYTTPDCAACELGRAHLVKRGVPYSEKEVSEPGDALAFQALGFDQLRFPALSVGSEKQTGYQSDAWTRALDAAGYPGKSERAGRPGEAPVERLAVMTSEATGEPSRTEGGEPESGDSPADLPSRRRPAASAPSR